MNAGELATRLGLPGIPAAGRGHDGGARPAPGRDDRRALPRRQRLDRRRRRGIAAAKARGLPVTCDTAPHYFTLNENAVGDYRTFAKVSPPLRSEDDRRAVAEAVADGTIDAVASDHSPHDQDSKRLPFEAADFGIVGLESLLPLSLELVHKGELALLDLLAA